MHDQPGQDPRRRTAHDGPSCLVSQVNTHATFARMCLSLMMYSYVVSKTLNLPLRSWGTKARLAAGEPCEREKTHTPQPVKSWDPGKAENWQRLLALSRLHSRVLPSPTWPPSGCPSLDSSPRPLPFPDSTLHAEGLVQGADRHAGPGWLAACTSTCPTPGGQQFRFPCLPPPGSPLRPPRLPHRCSPR